ncbi:uncharacterized protein LOC107263213 [Cephus cinctus]|uniref:Uncharacterized protein LOC107263213 n=1 Tax=Cephus cinctus TaxID=211228 RepID=A0AAJ7BGP6_CEPCN|nr:uncharacterized protein LOC107263213 [Cephus cinctus]
MKFFPVVAALLHVVLSGHVAVRLPYLNPAGVTYVDSYAGHSAPLGYAAAPALQHAPAPLAYGAHLQYAAPAAIPARLEAQHVGYATAQVPAVAAVPVVKHVPTVSHVPVTRIQAQHAVLQKQLDVVKPAVSTRKVEVRRPAIQKQFYDIEERVIIRPAGSALVELDEPTSKLQRGPAVIQPLADAAPISVTPVPDSHQVIPAGAISHAPLAQGLVPVVAHAPVHVTPAPVYVASSTHEPSHVSSTPAPSFEDESIVVENPNFRSIEQQTEAHRQQEQSYNEHINTPRASQANAKIASEPRVYAHSNGAAPLEAAARLAAHDPAPAVVASVRNSPEESHSNQHKLIELLTARGGVAEVGFGREGPASRVGDAGHVRARVLSATAAPEFAEAAGERVSTRRVVVSRPIETLQEFDVVEPATKVERVSVQEPTLIKTAHLEHVQVHGSVPVVGKALAPAVAHASVPVYQKTLSPAYDYYHH